MNNSELIKKADWALGDLSVDPPSGGKLQPEQANQFIRKLLIQPTLLRTVRSVPMISPTRKINKIQFASRIMRNAAVDTVSGVSGLAPADRSKPTTEQIELNTKEVIAEIRLPYDVIEDNLERGNIGQHQDVGGSPTSGGIKDTIMTLIAERAALDLEELALHGDTLSGDTYLQTTDGYLKRMTSNVVNFGNATIDKSLFKAGLKTMPDQYLRNRGLMRHYVSVDKEIEYRDTLANRETTLGDGQIVSGGPVFGYGVPVDTLATISLTATGEDSGFLTYPQNLLFGIQRDIWIETDKDISARVYIIVLTARIDFQIEEELACVKYTNVDD